MSYKIKGPLGGIRAPLPQSPLSVSLSFEFDHHHDNGRLCRRAPGYIRSRVFSTSDMTSAVHAHSSWNQRQPPSALDPAEQAYWRALSRYCICPNSFSYYSVPSKHMMKILEACGKGPLTTVQELDDLDPAFTCTVCRKYPGPREVYTWREAVSRS